MTRRMVNLACGAWYVESADWINLDFLPQGPSVQQANLLATLPIDSGSADVVYSSHFLEHIPRDRVAGFLDECLRILKPGGVLRLVLPDLENLCEEYLARRRAGEHDKADFVVIEMIDQCVRPVSGGELGRYYDSIFSEPAARSDTIEFVRYRTGESLAMSGLNAQQLSRMNRKGPLHSLQRFLSGWQSRLQRCRLRLGLAILPAAFCAQNVSLAAVGERHHWLWDFSQLERLLTTLGYSAVTRQNCQSSGIAGFPCFPLDIDASGYPRKGAESMYLEARKPLAD